MMKPYAWLLLVAAVVGASIHFSLNRRHHDEVPAKVLEAYSRWSAKFGRLYASPEEKNFRLKAFHKNFNFVEAHNSDSKKTYSVALNQFADMTDEEYKSRLALKSNFATYEPANPAILKAEKPLSLGDASEIVDLRGYLQQDFMQSSATCDDNYAWVAAVNMNANYYKTKNAPIAYRFSPQTYIDCAAKYQTAGCNGGSALAAFKYSVDWGIGTTNDYPYFGVERPCRVIGGLFKAKRAVIIPPNDNAGLKKIVSQKTVVSVGVDLGSQEARFYSGGVFSGPCGTEATTHALLVGYAHDTESNKDYWLIMSTFGTMWGEEGMMRIARYSTDDGVTSTSCGLNKYASYPEF
jgi:KDEL-tailed cysteine endopeptidase